MDDDGADAASDPGETSIAATTAGDTATAASDTTTTAGDTTTAGPASDASSLSGAEFGGTSSTSDGDASASTTGDTDIAGLDCRETCMIPAEQCFEPSECAAYCTTHREGWPPEVADSFVACTQIALCFLTLHDCMIGMLYPEGVAPTTNTIRASGLAAHAGRTLTARLEPFGGAALMGEGIVDEDGEVEVVLSAELSPVAQAWIEVRLDVDEDGACTPGVDLGRTVHVEADADRLWPDLHLGGSVTLAELSVDDLQCP